MRKKYVIALTGESCALHHPDDLIERGDEIVRDGALEEEVEKIAAVLVTAAKQIQH